MPMKFTLIETDSETHHESDYDTAVDLVHYTIAEDRMKVRAENGMVFELTVSRTSTRHSYLEPDFDLMDQTGETRYVQHDDEQQPETQDVSYALRGEWVAGVEPVLTVEEWWAREHGVTKLMLTDEQRQHLDAYDRFMDEGGMEPCPSLIPFPAADLQIWHEASEAVELGTTFDVAFSLAGQAALDRHMAAYQAMQAQQASNKASNQLHQQQAEQPTVEETLGQRLTQLTSKAQVVPPTSMPPAPSLWRRMFRR